jgi:putative transposase
MTFVPWKHRKAVAKDLKAIYQAASEKKAEEALAAFESQYQDTYPTVAQLWRRNWLNIIPIFDYPADIRKAIYTTNVIESLNYSLKKPLKTKGAFPTEDSLLKVLYLALSRASERWTMPVHDWRKALNWFAQLFGDRLLDRLDTQN